MRNSGGSGTGATSASAATQLSRLPVKLRPTVAIVVLDPGFETLDKDSRESLPAIRRSESHFIAANIRDRLREEPEIWHAAHVVPDRSGINDVIVSGQIRHSDGEKLSVNVSVEDITGAHWFTRTYTEEVPDWHYDDPLSRNSDPFAKVYDRIADDMRAYLARLQSAQISEIKNVSEIRFAERFVPEVYGDYLTVENGQYNVTRLPAEGDPVIERVREIRKRDRLFHDRLQVNYDQFNARLNNPYSRWRHESYVQQQELKKKKSEAVTRGVLGALAVVGGVLAQGSSSSAARTAGVIGIGAGGLAVASGFQKNAEAKIHEAQLQQLAETLDSTVAPQTIELHEETFQITGTVEEQYQQWQELMGQIYQVEQGAASDPVTL
ncbi:MAG: hypothetical protein AAF384_17380 [Pseudomonadota bacterium]